MRPLNQPFERRSALFPILTLLPELCWEAGMEVVLELSRTPFRYIRRAVPGSYTATRCVHTSFATTPEVATDTFVEALVAILKCNLLSPLSMGISHPRLELPAALLIKRELVKLPDP